MPEKFSSKQSRRRILPLLLAAIVLLSFNACVFQTAKNSPPDKSAAETAQANAATMPVVGAARSDEKKQTDKGDFIVEHAGAKNAAYADFDRKIREEKLLEKAADTLNRALVLPRDVYLRTKECGQANAHYDPNDLSITLCYELLEHFQKLFREAGNSAAEADRKMLDAARFAFLHELGHALVDGYKLPITGNEEDAADRLSSFICLEEMGEDGLNAALAAADAFRIESKKEISSDDGGGGEKDYSDEHLLHEQRFYNTLCMIYGSDADKFAYFVKEKFLPESRAERCPAEFERMAQSWTELLQKWRKD
jgi:hypothetical protein